MASGPSSFSKRGDSLLDELARSALAMSLLTTLLMVGPPLPIDVGMYRAENIGLPITDRWR